jgi:ferrochelatase
MPEYDAFLLVSFGGPDKPADVMPFLENVLRGKNVPRDRMEIVAEHYYHFGGRSPINDQNKALIAALKESGMPLPVYWGNRNWRPFLEDTLRQMSSDGVRRALALATSAFGSYSGCRQYIEDIARARDAVGDKAPKIDKIPPFSGCPWFVEAQASRIHEAAATVPDTLYFTAHSVPCAMADASPYVAQLTEASRQVAASVSRSCYRLVYQSRSGPPSQPWLEPDISDALREDHARGLRDVMIVPIGFLSDHMEVIYDLDVLARETCAQLGIRMVRAQTVENHPRFVAGILEMVSEYCQGDAPQKCADHCCPISKTGRTTR